MARISKPPEIRRQEIIETAHALFQENGYDQTTVRDIVRAVGVAQGLFYYYFKSKEEVLLAIVEKTTDALLVDIAAIIADPNMPPIDRIRATFAHIAGFMMQRYNTLPIATIGTELRAQFEAQTRQLLLPYLTTLLREAEENGDFSVPFPEYTLRFILAGFISLCTDENAPEADEVSVLLETLVERILALPDGSLSPEKRSN